MAFPLITIIPALLSVAMTSTHATSPWFCQSYDCPAFTSQNMGSFQIRNYEASNWVATYVDSTGPDPARRERSSMFRKLFQYISGQNSNNQKIAMTVPVLTKVEKRAPQDYRLTMMFYIPMASLPAPNDPEVFLVTRPAGPVFVKEFPSWWWVPNETYRDHWRQMKSDIGASAGVYDENVYYKAGYNSPYDYFKRKQHEVWVDKL